MSQPWSPTDCDIPAYLLAEVDELRDALHGPSRDAMVAYLVNEGLKATRSRVLKAKGAGPLIPPGSDLHEAVAASVGDPGSADLIAETIRQWLAAQQVQS